MLYRTSKSVVQAGIITVHAGSTAKDMAIAYIPKENQHTLAEELLPYIEKYYEQENAYFLPLVEMGFKEIIP